MGTLNVSYVFDGSKVVSHDGKHQIVFSGTDIVPGPGKVIGKSYKHALNFGDGGKGKVTVSDIKADAGSFFVQVIFQADGPVKNRENIVESNLLPFSIHLTKGKTDSDFNLKTTVENIKGGWAGPTTIHKKSLKVGKWYTVGFAYDKDTAALFLNEEILGVYSFPEGMLKLNPSGTLFFGTWVDGSRDHFKGSIAGFDWSNDIPENLRNVIDDQRTQPEWYIKYKYEQVKKRINLGSQISASTVNSVTGAYQEKYDSGAIVYHDSIGTAFEIHGSIYAFYNKWNQRNSLGFLVSDEISAADKSGKKSVFSKGAIYWSSSTDAVPVLGQIYINYEAMGESSKIGFPTGSVRKSGNGSVQDFQNASMYHKNGTTVAHEVHGAIHEKFKKIGGVNKWGFPICDESDIVTAKNKSIGKFSEFEGCAIYWSSSTGANEVHGDILTKYKEISGPLSELGLPTSGETNISGVTGIGKMNTFKNGSILWFGSYSSIIVALPFKIKVGRLNTKESEGFGRGQNDLFTKIFAKENNTMVYEKRHPKKNYWGGRNIKNIDFTIPHKFIPNNPNMTAWLRLKAWDDDKPFNSNDYLGSVEITLNAANGWGYKLNNGTITLKKSKIKSLTCGIIPQIDVSKLTEPEKFWGCHNDGTPEISWNKHAEAFRDVDSQTEWWDITDWVDKAFYELVVKGIAAGGNCFGMSTEAIYARKQRSIFGMPLNRFTDFKAIEHEMNIKQCFQAGAETVYWFLGQFLSGNTHDPVDVFNRSRDEYLRGNHPVICVAQNYNFSGAPHCILPVGWDNSSKPWKMTILDSNFPNTTRVLTVNPDNNTFEYIGGSTYRGGEWSGGRFHYIPFSILSHDPRTPVWDLILLLIAGTIIIFGDNTKVTEITDEKGNDLDIFGPRAISQMKSGHSVDEYFYSFKGFDRSAKSGLGDFFIRQESMSIASAERGTGGILNTPVRTVLAGSRLRNLATEINRNKVMRRVLSGRTVNSVLADSSIRSLLSSDVVNAISTLSTANSKYNFKQSMVGVNDGLLHCLLKQQLSEIRLMTNVKKNETHQLNVSDAGTSNMTFKLNSQRDKTVSVRVTNKLGLKGDNISVDLSDLPLNSSKELQINARPGLGGMDILGTSTGANKINIKIDAVIDGKKVLRKFRVPMDRGVRISIPGILSNNELHYSRIENLFGPSSNQQIVKGE